MSSTKDVFSRCKCRFCSTNKCKLLTYTRCHKCLNSSYLVRLKRIETFRNLRTTVCGFLCETCLTLKAMKTVNVKMSIFEMLSCNCECPRCTAFSTTNIPCCPSCKKEMALYKRTDLFHEKTNYFVGYKCEVCASIYHHSITNVSTALSLC